MVPPFFFLSLWGKVNIIKTKCAPKFNYLQALPLKKYFHQSHKQHNQFKRNNKHPRIKLKMLEQPIHPTLHPSRVGCIGGPKLTVIIITFLV